MKRDGSPEDFDRFVATSTGDLLRTGYLMAGDLTSAEDLVQECLFRVARRWPRVRSMEYPHAYARKILVNLALDGTERRKRHRSELDPGHGGVIEGRHDEPAARALGTVESNSVLIEALGALAPRQRATLVLRYFEDLSEAQVADVLGCSVGTVKSTTSHALDRLRRLLVPARAGGELLQSPSITATKGANDDDQPT